MFFGVIKLCHLWDVFYSIIQHYVEVMCRTVYICPKWLLFPYAGLYYHITTTHIGHSVIALPMTFKNTRISFSSSFADVSDASSNSRKASVTLTLIAMSIRFLTMVTYLYTWLSWCRLDGSCVVAIITEKKWSLVYFSCNVLLNSLWQNIYELILDRGAEVFDWPLGWFDQLLQHWVIACQHLDNGNEMSTVWLSKNVSCPRNTKLQEASVSVTFTMCSSTCLQKSTTSRMSLSSCASMETMEFPMFIRHTGSNMYFRGLVSPMHCYSKVSCGLQIASRAHSIHSPILESSKANYAVVWYWPL